MTLRERAGAAWQRVTRAWARLWRRRDGWGSEARDAAHALYRARYESYIAGLPRLPRTKSNETTEAFLAFAQVVQMLHEYGDDPILPPGIRRMVVRENQTRLQAFGEVGQPSWGARFMGSLAPVLPYLLIGGLLVGVTGWGGSIWNGWRADRMESQRDEAVAANERNAAAARSWRDQYERAHTEVIQAQHQAATTRETLEEERRQQRRRARRDQELNRANQELLANDVPPPWDRLLRSDAEADPGTGAGGGDAPDSHP